MLRSSSTRSLSVWTLGALRARRRGGVGWSSEEVSFGSGVPLGSAELELLEETRNSRKTNWRSRRGRDAHWPAAGRIAGWLPRDRGLRQRRWSSRPGRGTCWPRGYRRASGRRRAADRRDARGRCRRSRSRAAGSPVGWRAAARWAASQAGALTAGWPGPDRRGTGRPARRALARPGPLQGTGSAAWRRWGRAPARAAGSRGPARWWDRTGSSLIAFLRSFGSVGQGGSVVSGGGGGTYCWAAAAAVSPARRRSARNGGRTVIGYNFTLLCGFEKAPGEAFQPDRLRLL